MLELGLEVCKVYRFSRNRDHQFTQTNPITTRLRHERIINFMDAPIT